MTSPAILATGRSHSLFAADLERHRERIADTFSGRRLLVIGGAGSIGGATIRAMTAFRPAALHVVDHDENGLADLVRDLRSSGLVPAGGGMDLQLMPLDYGGTLARRYVRRSGPYDAVLHFAALKHVRSEKDPLSIIQMIDTNVLKQSLLLGWLAEDGVPARYFGVSTDKAANPVNFMGASKRLAEIALFSDARPELRGMARTSARFANVAFSAGSLLASFDERMRRRQPLAAPRDTRRYFVSLEESAHICLLAAAACPDRHVAVPRMAPESDLRGLVAIAEAFIDSRGYRCAFYEDEQEARAGVDRDVARGHWPLLVTPRDTDGEKEAEEFVGAGEAAVEAGFASLLAIPQRAVESGVLDAVLDTLGRWVRDGGPEPDKEEIARQLTRVIPEFRPRTQGRNLDARM